MDISKRALTLALEEYEDTHDETLEVATNYSGRGMFGKECLGVKGDASDLLRFVLEVVPAIDPISVSMETDMKVMYSEEWCTDVRFDTLHPHLIFYWPHIHVKDDEPDDAHPVDVRYDNSDPN